MEINKLTQRLLSEGYTKDNPPDWVRPWNDFYGGWTYPVKMLYDMVYETPCGLLTKGVGVNGHMSYMGVNWTVENDNYTVTCPKFDGNPCELNHPLLRDSTFGSNEKITHCACRLTDKPYDYGHSLEKAHDDNFIEADRLFEEFDKKLDGRACKNRSHYSRATKKWHMHYDPRDCTHCMGSGCKEYCKFLQTEMSPKKGNVFYDIKHTWIEKGEGFLPDIERVSITKGVKLLDRPVSVTLCEAIIKYSKNRIIEDYTNSRDRRNRLINPSHRYELSNFRCEVRASRDLLQDLADAREGIEVRHAAVDAKAAAEQKRGRRRAAKEKRIEKIEKMIVMFGFDNLEDMWKRRAEKFLESDRIDELERERKQTAVEDCDPQFNMFDLI